MRVDGFAVVVRWAFDGLLMFFSVFFGFFVGVWLLVVVTGVVVVVIPSTILEVVFLNQFLALLFLAPLPKASRVREKIFNECLCFLVPLIL